jgi:hypothetical protein
VGLLLLADPDGGRVLVISLFETEEDCRKGDETLKTMSPPSDRVGRQGAIEMYEVAADRRAPSSMPA